MKQYCRADVFVSLYLSSFFLTRWLILCAHRQQARSIGAPQARTMQALTEEAFEIGKAGTQFICILTPAYSIWDC